jgi:hypothetical protein
MALKLSTPASLLKMRGRISPLATPVGTNYDGQFYSDQDIEVHDSDIEPGTADNRSEKANYQTDI